MTRKHKNKSAAEQVSGHTAGRLAVYLRCLNALGEAGIRTVSSKTLAEEFHLNAAQIRKDLAYFGEFGVRGVGYYVKDLQRHLREILGLDRAVRVAIVGAGNLGMALADYSGFQQEGFVTVGLFDIAKGKVGKTSRGGVRIYDMADFRALVKKERIAIVLLAVPGAAAQDVLDETVRAGVRAVLNFSPGSLKVPAGVKVKHLDVTTSMASLSFFLARGEANGEA